ncbi:two-component regulator propeller domain-containing protein [Echinicola sediminis]
MIFQVVEIRKLLQLTLLLYLAILFALKEAKATSTSFGIRAHSQISIADGLAHNGVTSLLKDRSGYYWIGTYDGLNRYDGHRFKTFRNTSERHFFLSNRVRTLAEDKYGDIWIGTDEGISLYKNDSERFLNIYSNSQKEVQQKGPIIRDIYIDDEEELAFVSTEVEGLLLFDFEHQLLEKFLPVNIRDQSDFIVFNSVKLRDKLYLLATSEGLYQFDLNKRMFTQLLKNTISNCNKIIKLTNDLWMVTSTQGGFVLKEDSQGMVIVVPILIGEQLNSASLDQLGRLWIGTINRGIKRIDNFSSVVKGNTPLIGNVEEKEGGIRTSGIYVSERDGIWITTFNHGVFRFDLYPNPFYSIHKKQEKNGGLLNYELSSISPLSNHFLFITPNYGGSVLYNFSENKFQKLPVETRDFFSEQVTGAFTDKRGATWLKIGNDRLVCLKANGSFDPHPVLPQVRLPEGLRLSTMCEDGKDNLWVGNTKELFRLRLNEKREIVGVDDLQQHAFFKENPLYRLRTIYYDEVYDFLWVGTDADGLIRLKLGDNIAPLDVSIDQFLNVPQKQNSLPSNFVSSIVRLPNGEFYLGTERGGICKVLNNDGDNPQFIQYSEKNGLSNNVVKSILYDKDNNLWISTNIGLNRFNTEKQNFRIFKQKDGLPFEDFSYSSCKLPDGRLVFSGVSGICYFHPDDLRDDEKVPPLQLDNFQLFGRPVQSGDTVNGRVLMDKSIAQTSQIELYHDENVFSFDVNSLHFGNPENYLIRYQLKPVNNQWIEINSNHNTLYYSGLQPGKYTFQVMVSNSLGEWGEPKTLKIAINPPFWKTPLAYAFYFLILGIVLFVIIKTVLKFQRLRHNVEIHRLEKESEKRLHNAKLQFFSNISHEIKTPLALLQGPLDYLSSRFKQDVDVRDKLYLLKRQSGKIAVLVDQVHDFQKAEANALKMHLEHFNIDDFIRRIIQDFSFIVEQGQKSLVFETASSPTFVYADQDKLEKVLNNLLNNAIKFTSKGDKITVKYTKEGQDLNLSVQDTGTGIPLEDQSRIFDRFYQSAHNKSNSIGGSGIGLAFCKRLVEMHYGYIRVESELNEGTTFQISLPIVKEAPPGDIISTEKEILIEETKVADTSLGLSFDNKETDFSTEFPDAVVFVVEDNLEMQHYLQEVLGQFFGIKVFNDGAECQEALEEEWPDLVLSDVMMPKMNGFDLTRSIKSNIKTSHIPVVLLTASSTKNDKLKGYSGGADAYIQKPFEKEHLLVRIEALLLSRDQIRKRFEIDLPLTITKEESNDHAFMDKLYSLIDANLDNQELDLDSFSKELYLNRTHFYQKVKALTGQTPYELLKNYRLKKAAQMLYQGQFTVNEVYTLTGFKSRTHFAKIFKEKYGVTPGKYGEKMNESV